MTSDALLARWYRQFNRRYFNGELPAENVILCWEPVEDCDADCAKIHEAVTDKETDDFLIRIDPIYRTSLRVAKMTLLHEMVHVKLWPHVSHGARFQREMMRLAQSGAFRRLW